MLHRPFDRRRFLAGLAATAVGGRAAWSSSVAGAGSRTVPLLPEALPPSGLATNPFTLGVGSGDPLPTAVILWTRLAVDPQAADGQGGMGADDRSVRWEVSADDSFETLVAHGDSPAVARLAHSVHVDATGLEPDAWYFYRFRLGEHTSPIGRTRTSPADDSDVATLRVAVASCQHYEQGFYAAHRSIADDGLDLVLFLGDYIYESAANPAAVRSVTGGRTVTLADYRNRYATYKSDEHLQAAHQSCPWIVTWDDHEVENNYADLVSELGTGPIDFAAQRAAAYQAYYEHMPLRLDPPAGHEWPIHRIARWGTLADLFVLDGRQYRDDQPCDAALDILVDRDVCDPADGDRQMLGAEQEAWLFDGLTAANATWKVIAQQTVMSALVLGNTVINVDQWDGYPRARQRLLDHIEREAIADVVVLTGDIHAAGASPLRIDPESHDSATVAREFVCTAVSSSALTAAVGIDPETLDPSIFGLTYAELVHRGYCRCTVTPDGWSTEFVIVDDVLDPDSPTRVAATVTAPAGSPTLNVDEHVEGG